MSLIKFDSVGCDRMFPLRWCQVALQSADGWYAALLSPFKGDVELFVSAPYDAESHPQVWDVTHVVRFTTAGQ